MIYEWDDWNARGSQSCVLKVASDAVMSITEFDDFGGLELETTTVVLPTDPDEVVRFCKAVVEATGNTDRIIVGRLAE